MWTDAQTVRPYRSRIAVLQRTHDRASLQESYRCTTTDAQIVRPYKGLVVLLYYNGRTDRASLQRVSRLAVLQRTHDRASLRRATRLLWLSDLRSYPSRVSLVGIVLISL